MAYRRNVFINCPFDDKYRPLLEPLLFTILYLGFEPRISQTKSSSTIRINQIKTMIRESKFGIHDISRSKALKKGELPRFNMPYELGLDVGCHEYGFKKFKSKRILILEEERYHYQKVISDIAGQDISSHSNDPQTLVEKVRNWFSENHKDIYPSASRIWKGFNKYLSNLEIALGKEGYTKREIKKITFTDFIKFCDRWIAEQKPWSR